jgi:hypothetical protein
MNENYNFIINETENFNFIISEDDIYNYELGNDLNQIALYPTQADFPTTGSQLIIYVDKANNILYRWDGDEYIIISGDNSVVWGNITGTLSNQTDLQDALNNKQDVLISETNTAPISATDTGVKGEIRVTATAIYVCIATDTWVKADLSTW